MHYDMKITEYEQLKRDNEKKAGKVIDELLDNIGDIYPKFDDMTMLEYEKVHEKLVNKIIDMEVLK